MPWESVTRPERRALVEALVKMDFAAADAELGKLPQDDPELQLHRAMLIKVRGQYAEAQRKTLSDEPAWATAAVPRIRSS